MLATITMSRRWLTVLVVLLVALAASIVVMLTRDDGVWPTAGEPEIVTASQLSEFAADIDHPVYWLGERPGTEIELLETESGRIFVRYLEGGAEAGDERAEFVTVATYPAADGPAALRRAARERDGAEIGRSDDGAVLLIDPNSPSNAHLAHRGDAVQIEVFSPESGEALRLASRGAVEPVP